MCKAWDDHWKSGEAKGKTEGLVFSVRKLMQKQKMSMENALDFLEIPKEQQAEIVKMLQSA